MTDTTLLSNESPAELDHSVTDIFVEMLARPHPSKIRLAFCRDGFFPYGVNGDDPRIRRLLHHYFPTECPLIGPIEAPAGIAPTQPLIVDAADGAIIDASDSLIADALDALTIDAPDALIADAPVAVIVDEPPKPVHKPPTRRRKRKRSRRSS